MNQSISAVACTHGWLQRRTIGGDHPKAAPQGNQVGLGGQIQQALVEPLQRGHVQLLAGLVKGAVTDAAHGGRLAECGGKELVQRNLLGAAAHAHQRGHQGWQGQFAVARKGGWAIGAPGALSELVAGQQVGKVQKQ